MSLTDLKRKKLKSKPKSISQMSLFLMPTTMRQAEMSNLLNNEQKLG